MARFKFCTNAASCDFCYQICQLLRYQYVFLSEEMKMSELEKWGQGEMGKGEFIAMRLEVLNE